jgi:non-ribosomal peptide synthetase component F
VSIDASSLRRQPAPLDATSHTLIGERDVVLQKTPYYFDVSVWEFSGGL